MRTKGCAAHQDAHDLREIVRHAVLEQRRRRLARARQRMQGPAQRVYADDWRQSIPGDGNCLKAGWVKQQRKLCMLRGEPKVNLTVHKRL
ncbi:MAG TPA: hypothetical protein VFP68_13610 [Burkholderiaceae bacterium]|nr:hypothetical protein [Burkholderiaceae bacterium]